MVNPDCARAVPPAMLAVKCQTWQICVDLENNPPACGTEPVYGDFVCRSPRGVCLGFNGNCMSLYGLRTTKWDIEIYRMDII